MKKDSKGFKVKNKFRKQCLNRLKFYNNITKIKKDKKICKVLLEQIDRQKAKNILLYIPMDIEVNVKPLINVLRKRKDIKVFVPYMVEDSFKAVPFRLPLNTGRFNIKEPRNSSFKRFSIDLAIVPIVGVDSTFKRIGFGKGMYDRYFWRLKENPYKIFVQRTFCQSNQILSDKYDIQADYIISH